MTSAPSKGNHVKQCVTLEHCTPMNVYHTTIDVDTSAATIHPPIPAEGDVLSLQATNQLKSHLLLTTFDDELYKLTKHPTIDDDIQEYI